MTLNQLECFMVLAQRLNFTQAADDLFMAQPALSRLISALEKELDLQLFYRNSRSVALTPAGTVFFKKCPKILDEYRGSVVAARLAQEGYRGSLTLASCGTPSNQSCPHSISAFARPIPMSRCLSVAIATPACCPRWSGERWTPS